MKKLFENPTIDIVRLLAQDIVASSFEEDYEDDEEQKDPLNPGTGGLPVAP